MTNVNIDIKENDLLRLDPRIVNILLRDKTTGENLIWGTDNYASLGKDYEENSFMRVELITGINGEVIKPRCEKSKDEQQLRIRQKQRYLHRRGYATFKITLWMKRGLVKLMFST